MSLDSRRILSSDNLPSLPSVAIKVLEIVRTPEPNVKRIVNLIKSDPALAAKILRTANSSLFGVRQQVMTIEQAVPLLGTMTVNSLVLSFSLTANSTQPGRVADYFQQYWRSSLIQAAAADSLARLDRSGIPAEHFVAGLLQDVGVLGLLRSVPEQYVPVLTEAQADPERNLAQVEHAHFGVSHVDLSVELLRRWKLPQVIIEAVALHHHELDQIDSLRGSAPCRLTVALATAASIADYYGRASKSPARARVETMVQRYYRLDSSGLERYMGDVDNRVRQAAELFGLDVGEYPSYEEILSQANAELAEIALRAQAASLQAGAEANAVRLELAAAQIEKEEIRRLSYRDPLTNAYNRQFFEEALERECSRNARYGGSIGLIFLDVDHFKSLNDKHGHLVGDEVLKEVVRSVQSAVRDSDLVARFGGEEFVVLAIEIDQAELLKTAERVRRAVESATVMFQEQSIGVTASVGAAMLGSSGNQPESCRRLIETADQAMYLAKQLGRNQVQFRNCA